MPIPSKDFFAAFGAITYHYASVEFGIKVTVGAVVGLGTLDALIMTEPYSAQNLRSVAKCAIKEAAIPQADRDLIIRIIGEFKSFGPLRNAVAHSRWRPGTRPGSFKPVGIDIRSDSAKLIGHSADERDWTADELQAEALKLRRLNNRLATYHRESGLTEAIDKKDEEIKASIEALSGNSRIAS